MGTKTVLLILFCFTNSWTLAQETVTIPWFEAGENNGFRLIITNSGQTVYTGKLAFFDSNGAPLYLGIYDQNRWMHSCYELLKNRNV
jgi:hypothetical protein